MKPDNQADNGAENRADNDAAPAGAPGREAADMSDGVPFAGLTPECVLDAIDAVLVDSGRGVDGRQLTLNSYENRVYQVGIEEGAPLVAKFYRPHRWSDAAILEEHAFVAELAAREIPAVPPLTIGGARLLQFGGVRLSAFVI